MNLTNREKELCDIMFSATPWLTAEKTAEKMGLSVRTIETYLSNIYKKLNIDSREKLYGLWSEVPEGYDLREGLNVQIIEKCKKLYTVNSDTEFYYISGVVFGHLNNLNKNSLKNIWTSKEYSGQGMKDMITQAIKHDPDKLPFTDKTRPLIAGIMAYETNNDIEENKKGNMFYSGFFGSVPVYKMLPEQKE